MKKICLVSVPSPFLLDERVFPFLGILKVAAAWEKQGAKVDFLDLSGIENYLEVIKDYCDANQDDLLFVGLTATTPQMPNAFKIGQFIKENWNIPLVLGGSHVTLMHTASKLEAKENRFDRASKDIKAIKQYFNVLVCGDGELTLGAIQAGLKFPKMSGPPVIDVDDRKSPYFLSDEKFSELPNPARHLVNLDSYKYFIDGERATSMITQLGCPFQCTFCSGRSSPYLRNIRNRDIKSIVAELEHVYLTYGYKGMMFYDDELNVNKEMVPLMYAIADLGQKHGVEWKLRGFTKAELFTDEQAKAMVTAGFRVLLTGFESGDERILKNIRKRATRDENTKCVEIAKKHGLKVKALMSMGHAGESYESIENTKKWLLEVQPEDFDMTIITAYPGSPYFDQAISDGKKYIFTSKDTGDKLYQTELDYTTQADYYKGVPGDYTSYVWTDNIDAVNLVKERDKLETEVRTKLNIPFNPSNPTKKYEHSMGSSKNLPDWIYRSTDTAPIQYMPVQATTKKFLTVVK
jgi:anaerobic magnesium-protoporphyrin IX monomethyl ester cyclase